MATKKTSKGDRELTIAAICNELVEVYGSQKKFAKEYGLSESRVGKLLVAGNDNLTLYNLLRLAELSGKHPFVVLKAAKRIKELELLKRLFPESIKASKTSGMSFEAINLARKFQAMPPHVRGVLHDALQPLEP